MRHSICPQGTYSSIGGTKLLQKVFMCKEPKERKRNCSKEGPWSSWPLNWDLNVCRCLTGLLWYTQLRERGWHRKGICIASRFETRLLHECHEPQAAPWRQLKRTQKRGAGRVTSGDWNLCWRNYSEGRGSGFAPGREMRRKPWYWSGTCKGLWDPRVQWIHPENKPSGIWAGWTQ